MEISHCEKNLKSLFTVLMVLSVFTCFTAGAQELRVMDSVSRKPVQAATVMIMSESAKSVIKQGLTDENGAMSFPVQDTARLLISVFEVGYKKITLIQQDYSTLNCKKRICPIKTVQSFPEEDLSPKSKVLSSEFKELTSRSELKPIGLITKFFISSPTTGSGS